MRQFFIFIFVSSVLIGWGSEGIADVSADIQEVIDKKASGQQLTPDEMEILNLTSTWTNLPLTY